MKTFFLFLICSMTSASVLASCPDLTGYYHSCRVITGPDLKNHPSEISISTTHTEEGTVYSFSFVQTNSSTGRREHIVRDYTVGQHEWSIDDGISNGASTTCNSYDHLTRIETIINWNLQGEDRIVSTLVSSYKIKNQFLVINTTEGSQLTNPETVLLCK